MATAIVTGGSGALGSAVARALKERGHALVLADSPRSKERLEPLARELGAHACAVDLATPEGWDAVMQRANEPALAALVAGGWRGGAPVWEEDDATFDAMMSANLLTVRRGLRALMPGMVSRAHGSIVVVGSRNAERPWSGAKAASYTASKAAAVALVEVAAAEARHANVRVNAVLPSTMDTPANRASMPSADFSRWVSVESVARVIAFLLSDDARDISGAAVPVYGAV